MLWYHHLETTESPGIGNTNGKCGMQQIDDSMLRCKTSALFVDISTLRVSQHLCHAEWTNEIILNNEKVDFVLHFPFFFLLLLKSKYSREYR